MRASSHSVDCAVLEQECERAQCQAPSLFLKQDLKIVLEISQAGDCFNVDGFVLGLFLVILVVVLPIQVLLYGVVFSLPYDIQVNQF